MRQNAAHSMMTAAASMPAAEDRSASMLTKGDAATEREKASPTYC
jgi:hypothetical protein